MTEAELITLADFAASIFTAGRGPRVGTEAGFRAWSMMWNTLGMNLQQAEEALNAWALSGDHGGAWDPGSFVRIHRRAATADVGDMWALACRWVSDLKAGPVYRGGQKLEPPTMTDMLARPDRYAMARAVQAIGLDAIRERTTDNEGTLRAQFRKFYEEAQATQMARAVLRLEPGNQLPTGQRALESRKP